MQTLTKALASSRWHRWLRREEPVSILGGKAGAGFAAGSSPSTVAEGLFGRAADP